MSGSSEPAAVAPPRLERERAAATREQLLIAARALFAEQGYHATGTPEIVRRAAMTRGALYHHFAGKEDIFAEVFARVAGELVARTNAAAADRPDLWGKVSGSFAAYLHLVAAHRDYARIVLVDGPAVLGWARWRAAQETLVTAGVAEALGLLMDAGTIARQPAAPLAGLIQAALNDAALAIANADDPAATERATVRAFLSLLNGLRA